VGRSRDSHRQVRALLMSLAATVALGACAQRASAPPAGGGGVQRDDRADAGGQRASVDQGSNMKGSRCDTSAAPPRRAAVIAYDGAGHQRWSVPLPVGSQLDANVGPLVDGDTVYSTQGDQLRALAAGAGRQRWRLDLGGSVYDASVRDGVIVVRVGPLDAGHVLGVDAASGRELWRYTPPRGASLSWQQLLTDDGGVVVTGERGALVVLNRHDGVVRWTRQPASGPRQKSSRPPATACCGSTAARWRCWTPAAAGCCGARRARPVQDSSPGS
jgi:hypothetical protein